MFPDHSSIATRVLRACLLTSVVLTAFVAGAALRIAAAEEPQTVADAHDEALPAINAAYTTNLSGRVYIWDQGRLRPAARARVSTGSAVVRTDSSGRFQFAPGQRTGSLSVIQPGYDVVRRPIYYDRTVIVLRSLVVRAIYVPFSDMAQPEVQAYVHRLVDADMINAVVVDLKNEAGQVYSVAATATTDRIGATVQNDDVTRFLDELERKGVYRIGRVVTFLDHWFASWFPQDALRHVNGGSFIDGMGSKWASAYSSAARRYNAEIGAAASGYVEEIQYDYVRLPYERNLLERTQYNQAQRVQAINRFAREASERVHLAGLAISFDTFGVISTAGDDQGIGQSVEGVAPYLDYISPMVYPSGWHAGSLGFAYPPEHPGPVVRLNVQATVDRVAAPHTALVRPWLQDFHDYQSRGLLYQAREVHAQIAATAEAGGVGFMLWDPSMRYEQQALALALRIAWPPIG